MLVIVGLILGALLVIVLRARRRRAGSAEGPAWVPAPGEPSHGRDPHTGAVDRGWL